MPTCPMCNADDVSDDPADMQGHDMSKHDEQEAAGGDEPAAEDAGDEQSS